MSGLFENCMKKLNAFQDRQRPEGEASNKQHRRKYAQAKGVQAESAESSGTSDPELSMHKVEHSCTPNCCELVNQWKEGEHGS